MRLFAEKFNELNKFDEYKSQICFKPNISVNIIGKKRFWAGLITGILFLIPNIFSNILFNVKTFETVFNVKSTFVWLFVFINNIVYSAFVSSVVLLIWFINKKWTNQKWKIKNRFIVINIVLICYISNLLSSSSQLLFIRQNLSVKIILGIVGILAFIIYSNAWNSIRLIFKTEKWRLINLGFIILYATIITIISLLYYLR